MFNALVVVIRKGNIVSKQTLGNGIGTVKIFGGALVNLNTYRKLRLFHQHIINRGGRRVAGLVLNPYFYSLVSVISHTVVEKIDGRTFTVNIGKGFGR